MGPLRGRTLRRIASALGAHLEIQLVKDELERRPDPSPSRRGLSALISPLFWDREIQPADLTEYPAWVLARVLMFGNLEQVKAARRFFGDEAILSALQRRIVDRRTRNFWRLVLEQAANASQGSRT